MIRRFLQIGLAATAMVAIEKANLGLQLAVEARNQALNAYQQMMQMPL